MHDLVVITLMFLRNLCFVIAGVLAIMLIVVFVTNLPKEATPYLVAVMFVAGVITAVQLMRA